MDRKDIIDDLQTMIRLQDCYINIIENIISLNRNGDDIDITNIDFGNSIDYIIVDFHDTTLDEYGEMPISIDEIKKIME